MSLGDQMSCSECGQDTCGCSNAIDPEDPVNPNAGRCTVCTGDCSNNIWFTPGPPGFPGKCKLDELTYDQVEFVLSKNPSAKRDLLRITTDPNLIRLANETKMVGSDQQDSERFAERLHRNSLPIYTVKMSGDF